MYLGEVVRRVLVELINEKKLFRGSCLDPSGKIFTLCDASAHNHACSHAHSSVRTSVCVLKCAHKRKHMHVHRHRLSSHVCAE